MPRAGSDFFPSLVTSSSPSPGCSSWDTCRAYGAERSQFHVQMRAINQQDISLWFLTGPLPSHSQPPSWGTGEAGSCSHSSWATRTAPAVQLRLSAARLASWAWLAPASPHSWFPCNEDVERNRTGGRWWSCRTSNSLEQLKTDRRVCVLCTHTVSGWRKLVKGIKITGNFVLIPHSVVEKQIFCCQGGRLRFL